MMAAEPAEADAPELVEERVEAVTDRLRGGGMAGIIDAGRRRGLGSLVIVGEAASEQTIARLMELGGGLLVLCMPPERFDQLDLQTVDSGRDQGEGAQGFATPIRARGGAASDASARDRAATVAAAVAPDATRSDLVAPGSVFPARAGERGLFSRRRRIEAAVDLSRLAGSPTGTAVLCEILGPSQQVLEGRQLESAAAAAGAPLVSVDDVLRYRRLKEPIIDPPVIIRLPTTHGLFRAAAYYDSAVNVTHMAVWSDEAWRDSPPAPEPRLYVHRGCTVGDALGHCPAGCGTRISAALERLARRELDLVVYQRSKDRWRHLFEYGTPAHERGAGDRDVHDAGDAGADLDQYGVVRRILLDFADGPPPKGARQETECGSLGPNPHHE